jgi:ferredoxin
MIDYSRCNGNRACVSNCPSSIFGSSLDERWCKPANAFVKNNASIRIFHDDILSRSPLASIAKRRT